jgi:hypothetical protein
MLLNENSGVTAIFASFTTPGAPVNVSAYPGDGRISISFDPPLNNGGDLVTGYAVSCNSGMVTGQSVSSPINLLGLSNGTTYDCRVTATNSVGAGAASSQVSAIPSSSNTISLVSVKSQKSHGAAGVFALDIDPIPTINGAITIEPRIGNSGHTLVFTFSDEVTSFGTINVIDSNAVSLDAPIAFKSGAEIIVTTGPVANNSRFIVSIPNVNGSTSVSIAVGFLVGDVTNSRFVNAADIAVLKSRIGRPVTANNFWFDLDLSGNINGLDLSIVKAHGGRALR